MRAGPPTSHSHDPEHIQDRPGCSIILTQVVIASKALEQPWQERLQRWRLWRTGTPHRLLPAMPHLGSELHQHGARHEVEDSSQAN